MSKINVRTSFVEAGDEYPRVMVAPATFDTMVSVSKGIGYNEVASIEGTDTRVWQGERVTDESRVS